MTQWRRLISKLRRDFPRQTTHEIEQEIALASLLTEEPALIAHIAKRRLQDIRRRDAVLDRYFTSYQTSSFDEDELACDHDLLLEQYFSSDEWSAVAAGLPYPAQKLAKIARRQAEAFEDVPSGVWTKQNLTELRRRIKREFMAWQHDHSERAYFRARQTLVTALRRHRGYRLR